MRTQKNKLKNLIVNCYTLTTVILCLLTLPLNYTCLNSYSASSEPLATGPKPPMEYPLDNPSDFMQHL